MLMSIAFVITLICVILGVLIINAEITLKILGNITFKWAFDKKGTNKETGSSRENSNDYAIQAKGLEKIEIKSNKISRWIGYRLLLLGGILMMFVGVMYAFSSPQPIAEFEGKIYIDDQKMGIFLINLEVLSISIFVIIATLKSMGKLDLLLGKKTKSMKRVRR